MPQTRVIYMCEWAGHGMHPIHAEYAHGIKAAGVDIVLGTSAREYEPGTVDKSLERGLRIAQFSHFFDAANGFRFAATEFAEWLRNNPVDIVHCQGFRELRDIKNACRVANLRPAIVMTDRNSLAWRGGGVIKRIAYLSWARPNIVALTSAHARRLECVPWMKKRVHYIPNGVNTDFFRYQRRRANLGDRDIRVIFPASLTPQKGHFDLLQIWQVLRRKGTRVRLLVAGSGPYEAVLRDQITEMGLSCVVRLLGKVPWYHLPVLYRRADMGVYPSYREMMPNAVLEMMATGLPIVAYSVGALPEMIKHGETGYLVPAGNKEAFLACVETLVDNSEVRISLGKTASERVAEQFSIGALGKRTADLYRSITRQDKNGLST